MIEEACRGIGSGASAFRSICLLIFFLCALPPPPAPMAATTRDGGLSLAPRSPCPKAADIRPRRLFKRPGRRCGAVGAGRYLTLEVHSAHLSHKISTLFRPLNIGGKESIDPQLKQSIDSNFSPHLPTLGVFLYCKCCTMLIIMHLGGLFLLG